MVAKGLINLDLSRLAASRAALVDSAMACPKIYPRGLFRAVLVCGEALGSQDSRQSVKPRVVEVNSPDEQTS
jgi:hypothetical protein